MSDSPPEQPGQPGNKPFKLPPREERREIIQRVLDAKREKRKLAVEQMAQFKAEEANPTRAGDKVVPFPGLWWKVAVGIAAVLVVTVSIWLKPQPARIQLAALPDSERTGEVALPKNLQLDLKGRQLELSEGGDRLVGAIEPLAAESSQGVAAFNVTLSGKDAAGTEGHFKGKLWLTNTAGVTTIRKQGDVSGARMRGLFEIVGKITNAVEHVYAPRLP